MLYYIEGVARFCGIKAKKRAEGFLEAILRALAGHGTYIYIVVIAKGFFLNYTQLRQDQAAPLG